MPINDTVPDLAGRELVDNMSIHIPNGLVNLQKQISSLVSSRFTLTRFKKMIFLHCNSPSLPIGHDAECVAIVRQSIKEGMQCNLLS